MKNVNVNFLYGNDTNADLSPYHAQIAASLKASGTLPAELADIFSVRVIENGNPDGSHRYVIGWA